MTETNGDRPEEGPASDEGSESGSGEISPPPATPPPSSPPPSSPSPSSPPPSSPPPSSPPPSRPSLIQRLKAVWENPAYRFIGLFLPYLALASLGYPLMVEHSDGIIQAFIHATAAIEYGVFALFSDDVRLDGKMIWFGQFVVKIIDECTGIYEMLIFAAAVLAFPTSWAKRGVGLLLGCPLIYLFNVVRIAGLIVVGRYWAEAFEFMHLYFWQATMIAMITSVWMLWIVKVVQREDQALPDSP